MSDLNVPMLSLRTVLPLDGEQITRRGVIFRQSSGKVCSRIGFGVSLYFFEGSSAEKRRNIMSIMDHVLSLFPGKCTHLHRSGKRSVKISAKNLGDLRTDAASRGKAAGARGPTRRPFCCAASETLGLSRGRTPYAPRQFCWCQRPVRGETKRKPGIEQRKKATFACTSSSILYCFDAIDRWRDHSEDRCKECSFA